MTEDFDQSSSHSRSLEQYWGIVSRRRWWIVLPVFVVWAAVWGISWFLPASYKSETLILIEQQKVPEQYVVSNVANDLQDRLQSMTQQIMSRTRLLRIIEQFDLYAGSRSRMTEEQIVDRMRKDIEIQLVQAPGRKDDLSAFRVSYSSRDPRVAQQVTNELTSLFIEDNLQSRRQQSQSTTGFLDSQMQEARQKLSGQEERVRDFKTHYLGELPTQMQSNVQILTGLQARLQGATESLSQSRQQKTYLESLLAQYRAVHESLNRGGDQGQLPPALDEEIARLKAQLAEVAARYTEKHPDYKKLKEQLQTAERMRDKIASEVKTAPPSGTDDKTPATYSDLKDMSAMLQIESQLKANEVEIANRQQQVKSIEAQIDDYQKRINEAPVREQQLADLTRDYDQSRANYESLLAKRNQSELATNLEERQQGEQFRILDPASLPQKPYKPDRLLLSAIGLLLGCVLAAAITGALELGDDRVHGERDLEGVVTAPILSEIPTLRTVAEETWARRRFWIECFAGSLMLMATAAGLFATYYYG
jgi:polysaccharide chain length determinant protein (PEP-CTERM system associated)